MLNLTAAAQDFKIGNVGFSKVTHVQCCTFCSRDDERCLTKFVTSLSSCVINAFDDMYSGVVDFRFPSSQLRFTTCFPLAPVVTFMNETAQDSGRENLFSVEQLGDRWLADHLVASTTLDANHWILFDSVASANCCPKDFGSEWPLLPLNGEPPPLRSISGQPLHVYGRRLIRMTLDGVPTCFHSYVCDVPYPVVSVARLLLQGYKVNMNSPYTCTLFDNTRWTRSTDCSARLLLFLCPQLDSFNEYDFAPLCNEFHAQFNSETPPGLMATFTPVYYHADRWILKDNMLIEFTHVLGRHFLCQVEPKIDLFQLKIRQIIEPLTWSLKMVPKELLLTTGVFLKTHVPRLMLLRVEPSL